jgi:uncharacterized Zn finger protein
VLCPPVNNRQNERSLILSWYGRRERYGSGYGYGGFAPYVPVARRRANAASYAQKLAKKEGRELAPVKISGRAMATTYWGKAWCDNLEAYSDFANRLPRGRTYARNGSVIDLQIKKGKIEAIVSGSQIYSISISIETLSKASWTRLKAECSQSIASLIDLLQGRFDAGVMQRLAHPTDGLFPRPKEIKMKCSCPDSAGLCKHLAAVLYGVGNRLDTSPELLFALRNVDHLELVSQAVTEGNLDRTLDAGDDNSLAGSDLGEMFGIDLVESETARKKAVRAKRPAADKPRETGVAVRKIRRKTVAKPKPAAVKAPVVDGAKSGNASAATRRKTR